MPKKSRRKGRPTIKDNMVSVIEEELDYWFDLTDMKREYENTYKEKNEKLKSTTGFTYLNELWREKMLYRLKVNGKYEYCMNPKYWIKK